jgi:hypothetical protein
LEVCYFFWGSLFKCKLSVERSVRLSFVIILTLSLAEYDLSHASSQVAGHRGVSRINRQRSESEPGEDSCGALVTPD